MFFQVIVKIILMSIIGVRLGEIMGMQIMVKSKGYLMECVQNPIKSIPIIGL